MKKAFITGITGQDGSYLAELLLEKGYEVHGLIRRSSTFNTERINHLYQDPHLNNTRLFLHYGDVADGSNINRLIEMIKPEEIYHLAAQSHVKVSFELPEYTADVTGIGTLRILDAIKESGIKTKFYQASSSEMFGKVNAAELPITEKTPFRPRSPYGCAKVYAYWITKNYRESYGLFAVNGILFNHESPRRGETFVTRKITKGLSRIKLGKEKKLYLGNLDSRRDWGYAKDYVFGMYLMLQQEEPQDYILSTGETHTIREFVEETAKVLGIDLVWHGEGLNEKGVDNKSGKTIIEIDPKYFRPAEVDVLLGDSQKAKKSLNWEAKVKFKELVEIMTKSDLATEEKEKNNMKKNDKIYVAGHKGLVGSAIIRALKKDGYKNITISERKELDLLDQDKVNSFFENEKPDYVFLAAAKVGGIMANKEYPADFIYENLTIQNNVINASYKNKVKRLLFLGSSCIYPKLAPQPIKEEFLLTSPLEQSNEAYAIAKIAGLKLCEYYNKQYKTQYISVMPTNLYGPNDNYDLETSHVLPAMIRKFHEAKINNHDIVLWGTGSPKREFLHVDDLAEAVIFLINYYNGEEIINIGVGEDLSIKELAEIIKDVIGFKGKIIWDTSKPDGTPRKLLDISKINRLGWKYKIKLQDGIKTTYEDFLTKKLS